MLRPLRPQSHTRTVVQPQSSSRLLFLRHFQPFPPPDPLHPVLAHLPSCLLEQRRDPSIAIDRKSTRLNSSHDQISYAVFCLKKNNSRAGSLEPALAANLPPRL